MPCAPCRARVKDRYDYRISPVEVNDRTVTVEVEMDHNQKIGLWKESNRKKCFVFMGQHKAGTTSIVAAITGKNLPIGERTRGISVVHMKDKDMLVVDAPGSDDVQTENLSNMDADMLAERLEHFTSEMLKDISVNIIHVMRRQTRPAMRNLWGRMKSTQHGQRHDLGVVYNLYPHAHDMAQVKEKVRKTRESYGEFVDLKDDWNFSTRQDGVCVHHWFWLDNNWSEGRAVNAQQVKEMSVHFRTLNTQSAESVRRESTHDVIKRAIQNATTKFVQPQGHGCEVLSEEITTSTHKNGYKPISKFTSTLVDGARMADGFNPTPRFALGNGQLVITVAAENCRLVEGCLEQGEAGQREGLVSVRSDVPYPGCPHWKCTHIAIKKVPHLDLGQWKAEDNAEQDGRFDLYYPRFGDKTHKGTLTFLERTLQNGLLIVRLAVTSAPQPVANHGLERPAQDAGINGALRAAFAAGGVDTATDESAFRGFAIREDCPPPVLVDGQPAMDPSKNPAPTPPTESAKSDSSSSGDPDSCEEENPQASKAPQPTVDAEAVGIVTEEVKAEEKDDAEGAECAEALRRTFDALAVAGTKAQGANEEVSLMGGLSARELEDLVSQSMEP